MSNELIETEINEILKSFETDGFDTILKIHQNNISIIVTPNSNACMECLMPKNILNNLINTQVSKVTSEKYNVDIEYAN